MTQTHDQTAFTEFEPEAERSSEQIEAKAHELLAQLTLDEKIEMMDGDVSFWSGLAEMMGGGYSDRLWHAGVISRLGIPGIRFAEDLPFFDKDATEIEYDLWHGYRKLERDGNAAAFAFGFGLSYTRYRYVNLELLHNQLGPSETLKVSLDVTNTGAHAGEEVVQLYVSPIGSAVERAPKELKAFARIALQPGETKTVQLNVPISRLAYYDETQANFVVEPLEYELFVGAHSLDQHALKARFMVHSE